MAGHTPLHHTRAALQRKAEMQFLHTAVASFAVPSALASPLVLLSNIELGSADNGLDS